MSANGYVLRTDLRSHCYISKLVHDVKHDLLHDVMNVTASTNYFFFDNISPFLFSANAINIMIFSLSWIQSENIFDLKCLSMYWNFWTWGGGGGGGEG